MTFLQKRYEVGHLTLRPCDYRQPACFHLLAEHRRSLASGEQNFPIKRRRHGA
jgi:hypothetical protein